MSGMKIEVLKVRHYKAGYEVRTEVWSLEEEPGHPVIMRSAYNPNGDYIGNSRDAHRLCVRHGIAPEKAAAENDVCSIGYSKRAGKWYG